MAKTNRHWPIRWSSLNWCPWCMGPGDLVLKPTNPNHYWLLHPEFFGPDFGAGSGGWWRADD